MTRTTVLIPMVAMALFFMSGCGHTPVKDSGEAAPAAEAAPTAEAAPAQAACTCEKGKAGESVWCDKCNKGYINSEAVKCRGCFDAKNGGAACEGCAKPSADEAACTCGQGKAGESVWCSKCNKGYINSEAVKCRGCFDAKNGGSPCEGCAKGSAPAADGGT